MEQILYSRNLNGNVSLLGKIHPRREATGKRSLYIVLYPYISLRKHRTSSCRASTRALLSLYIAASFDPCLFSLQCSSHWVLEAPVSSSYSADSNRTVALFWITFVQDHCNYLCAGFGDWSVARFQLSFDGTGLAATMLGPDSPHLLKPGRYGRCRCWSSTSDSETNIRKYRSL